MIWIAKRIIAVLNDDSPLTTLLGGENVYVTNAPIRKSKFVTVSPNPGEDQNNIPADFGDIDIQAVVSRTEVNAHAVCLNIIARVDDILNKGEVILANASYKILSFVRLDGTDLNVDDDTNEFWQEFTYRYILSKTT